VSRTNGNPDLVPAPAGNKLALDHGFYSTISLAPDVAEVEELATALREIAPAYSSSDEPAIQACAAIAWRLRRAYRDLDENGITRGKQLAPILTHLSTVERTFISYLDRLGLRTLARADLGLGIVRIRATTPSDLSRLSTEEVAELYRLQARAQGDDVA
jgi:hypothetical protein